MRLVLIRLVIVFLLVMFLKLVSFFLSEKQVLSREELTSYECGFEHHGLSRVPFSFRYYFLTLIFLLFDLEIVLLVFIPFSSWIVRTFFLILVRVFFLLFLFFGLLYE